MADSQGGTERIPTKPRRGTQMSLDVGVLDRTTDVGPGYAAIDVRRSPRKSDAKGLFAIHLADAFTWLKVCEPQSIHAVVTDPPYGLKEYSDIEKRRELYT